MFNNYSYRFPIRTDYIITRQNFLNYLILCQVLSTAYQLIVPSR
nr:MAG TPA: hypothetical protein [Herelleviridae sp.]